MTDTNWNLLLAGLVGNHSASRRKIAKVQEKLVFRLPESYVDFLLTKNGGEGFVGKRYIVLWKVEDLIAMNDAYRVSEFAPALFLFGSDGGGEAFGFDTRSEVCRVVSVPFVGMDLQLAKDVAPDFKTFFSVLLSS